MSGITKVDSLRMTGYASDWTSQNLVLENGCIGAELDTNKTKIGDGATAWADLAYVGTFATATWQDITGTVPNNNIFPNTANYLTSQTYNIMMSLLSTGAYTSSQVLYRGVLNVVTFPVGLTTSPTPYCSVAPTAATTLAITIVRAGSTVASGTVNFAGGSNTGTFTFASAFTSEAGDLLVITSAASADATFQNASVTITVTHGGLFSWR
jgi:hypothetical protein